MSAKIMLAAAVTLALGAPAWAQAPANGHAAPPDPFMYKSDAEMDGLTAAKPGSNAPVPSFLSDHENYFVEVVGRTVSGQPEFHAHWIDYVTVQKGEGTLTYGGTDSGAHETGNGEQLGGTISGGQTVDLHPGSYFEIPAGMWHMIALKPGTTHFRYLVIKARQ